jgi:UDP-3-O-[3-hydroxymyristoyl] glucosamine N-acyltransferase
MLALSACPVHSTATLRPDDIHWPSAFTGCVIGAHVQIGARTALLGGNHVAHDSRLGDDVRLFPNVVIYSHTQIGHRTAIHAGTVIGSDGYGYVFNQGRHVKILQVGNVVIGDDVEIGSNTSIDRAALGSTVVGDGTKIDNLVHVAHNVVFGKHCLILGQCGFAGSTVFGDYCVIASQSGVGGHLKIGRQVTIGAKSGVMRDVAEKEMVLGYPAVPDKQAKRQWIGIQRLPELTLKVRELEKQIAALTAKSD